MNKSKFLRIVSIIAIAISALSLIYNVLSVFGVDNNSQNYTSDFSNFYSDHTNVSADPVLIQLFIIAALYSAVGLGFGIFGVANCRKTQKSNALLFCGVAWIVLTVVYMILRTGALNYIYRYVYTWAYRDPSDVGYEIALQWIFNLIIPTLYMVAAILFKMQISKNIQQYTNQTE